MLSNISANFHSTDMTHDSEKRSRLMTNNTFMTHFGSNFERWPAIGFMAPEKVLGHPKDKLGSSSTFVRKRLIFAVLINNTQCLLNII